MTARPPFDDDALSPEERALAARLSAVDAGGPPPALDARVLAAARAAVAPDGPGGAASTARTTTRRRRRWPTAVGAAATLVIAVGLAWQLKPLLDMPPPLRRPVEAAPVEAEVLAQAEPVSPAAAPPPPVASVAGVAAESAAPAARKAAPRPAAPPARVASRRAQAAPVVERESAPAQAPGEYLDEAVGDHADSVAAPVAAAAAPPAPPAPPATRDEAARLERVEVTGGRVGDAAAPAGIDTLTVSGTRVFPPVASDASLGPVEWLERIRLRRDAGDVDAARASLRLFRREYPRHRLPDDLRALLAEPR
ncbi:MAG: hypothetical protein ACOY37_09825 [Pseudomonadota bacterium]